MNPTIFSFLHGMVVKGRILVVLNAAVVALFCCNGCATTYQQSDNFVINGFFFDDEIIKIKEAVAGKTRAPITSIQQIGALYARVETAPADGQKGRGAVYVLKCEKASSDWKIVEDAFDSTPK